MGARALPVGVGSCFCGSPTVSAPLPLFFPVVGEEEKEAPGQLTNYPLRHTAGTNSNVPWWLFNNVCGPPAVIAIIAPLAKDESGRGGGPLVLVVVEWKVAACSSDYS